MYGRAYSPPCITARRGGRAINRYREASADREDGVVFRSRTKRKTTITASRYGARASRPSASVSVASRNFINDAATPPCGNARRGILLASNLFPPSITAPTVYATVNTHGPADHAPKANHDWTDRRCRRIGIDCCGAACEPIRSYPSRQRRHIRHRRNADVCCTTCVDVPPLDGSRVQPERHFEDRSRQRRQP